MSSPEPDPVETPIKKLTQVVTDYQGGAWVTRDKTLLHLDPYGKPQPPFELKPFGKKGKKLIDLESDPLDGSVWVASKEQVAHVSADGVVLERQISHDFKKKKQHLRDIALYVDVIAPELAFTAPLQRFVNNNRPALILSFTDIGEGVDTNTVRFFEEDEVELDATCSSPQEGSASCLPTARGIKGTEVFSVSATY